MTWVDGAAGSLFDVDNLPYGVFSRPGEEPRVGVRIGEHVARPLAASRRRRCSTAARLPAERSLNALMAQGRGVRRVGPGLDHRAARPTRPSATGSSRT